MGCKYSYYTRKEIEEQIDCWILIKDKIYDVTSYIDYHPGGVDCILKNKGKDCSEHYKMHNIIGQKTWELYFVGFLKERINK